MTKEQNNITVRILTIVAVVFMTVSIVGITVYNSVLNDNLYKDALSKSDIYVIVTDIIERNISESLVAWEKNLINELIPGDAFDNNKLVSGALSFVLNTVVEQQTPELVANVFDKIGLAEVFQNVVEKTIERDIAWLKGEHEAHEMFSYIPTPEKIESLQGGTFTQLLDHVVKNSIGINELAQCTGDAEINANITQINQGNVKGITCTSPQIDKLLNEEFANSKINTVINKVGGGADTIAQDSQVNALLTDVYDFSLVIASVKQRALDMREMVQSILKWSYFLLVTSIILAGVAIFLQKRGGQIKRGIIIIFSTGASVTIFAVLYYVIFAQIIIGSIPFESVKFSTNALTSAEGALLVNSVKFIVDYIVVGIISTTFVIGVWITVISAILYGVLMLYKNREKLQQKFDSITTKK